MLTFDRFHLPPAQFGRHRLAFSLHRQSSVRTSVGASVVWAETDRSHLLWLRRQIRPCYDTLANPGKPFGGLPGFAMMSWCGHQAKSLTRRWHRLPSPHRYLASVNIIVEVFMVESTMSRGDEYRCVQRLRHEVGGQRYSSPRFGTSVPVFGKKYIPVCVHA